MGVSLLGGACFKAKRTLLLSLSMGRIFVEIIDAKSLTGRARFHHQYPLSRLSRFQGERCQVKYLEKTPIVHECVLGGFRRAGVYFAKPFLGGACAASKPALQAGRLRYCAGAGGGAASLASICLSNSFDRA